MPQQEPAATRPDVPLLEMRGITKAFGSLLANDRVDFTVLHGEVHALVGENGAGKTTLMNVLFGIVRLDDGEIWLKGNRVEIRSPMDAARHQIGMVHQHFKLVPSLTVAQNVFLGREPGSGFMEQQAASNSAAAALSERYGLQIDPTRRVQDLSVGQRQRVEILKALSYDASLLILDEPTAVLTPQEADELFRVVRELRARDKTIIFITHKLGEVKAVADRFTVMRDGRRVATVDTGDVTEADIARLMVGRDVLFRVAKEASLPGAPILRVEKLSGLDVRGTPAVRGISLEVREGEIVGIAGVEGNGQAEVSELLAGLRRPTSGHISVGGRDITHLSVSARRAAGLAIIPEDRLDRGLSPDMSVTENLAAGHYGQFRLASHGIVRIDKLRQWASTLIGRFDIRGARLSSPLRALSGGNMQKVVVARELSSSPQVVLAAQPTRGLDVGATEYVHETLLGERSRRKAVLLISSELSEIMSLSDRILVMYRGRVTGEFKAATATDVELGLYMMGVKGEGSDAVGASNQ